MEGKFYRHKSPNHPHTNMAKAALNMLTRTSAGDYSESRIYMNRSVLGRQLDCAANMVYFSVDTGWINDENPLDRAKKTADKHNFQVRSIILDLIWDPVQISS